MDSVCEVQFVQYEQDMQLLHYVCTARVSSAIRQNS